MMRNIYVYIRDRSVFYNRQINDKDFQQIIRLIEKIDTEINKEIDGLERSAVDSQIERDRQIDELDRQIQMVRQREIDRYR